MDLRVRLNQTQHDNGQLELHRNDLQVRQRQLSEQEHSLSHKLKEVSEAHLSAS